MVRWRVWFDDESVWDSARHVPTDLPTDGFLTAMVWADISDRRILQGTEWYFVAGDVWDQAMNHEYPPGTPESVETGILARYPGAHIMRGRTVSNSVYERTQTSCYNSFRPST